VTGGYRRLHCEGLHGLYSSPDIQVIKSRTRRTRHVAHIGERRDIQGFGREI
jgi:hypothetical protein